MPLHVPAEHAPHDACWMAWPYRDEEWPHLSAAQAEILAFAKAIATTERVKLLVHPDVAAPTLPEVEIHRAPYGDSWTRDTAPIFAHRDGELVALVFGFDGWGHKYEMAGDEDLAERIADLAGVPSLPHDWILEGGAIELDGEGTLLTTRCLELRNPGRDVTADLKTAFQVDRVVWLDAMLANDHTDGHIDTLARFVAPGRVACMIPEAGDPNEATLRSVREQVEAEGFEVAPLPSPGSVRDGEGRLLPASYCNYYLANGQVLVPTYGVPNDEAAVQALAALFGDRRVVGVSARAIIEGGGALHCITQQQPA